MPVSHSRYIVLFGEWRRHAVPLPNSEAKAQGREIQSVYSGKLYWFSIKTVKTDRLKVNSEDKWSQERHKRYNRLDSACNKQITQPFDSCHS